MDVDRGTSTATRDGGTAVLLKPVELVAPPELHRVIANFGRTEDICFSPNNRRLAIAGFGRDRIFVIDLDWGDAGERAHAPAVTGIAEVAADDLREPHGLSWLDDATLVVANRAGAVTILRLPAAAMGSGAVTITALASFTTDAERWPSPGSVTAVPLGPDLHELLVCNNDLDTVTRHVIDTRCGARVAGSEPALAAAVELPDGVAVSADRRWLAISNHNSSTVLLFRNRPGLGPSSLPDGVLRDLAYPHGLRFTADGRHLVVADAGAPHVHVFSSDDGDWSGERRPTATHHVMDDASFQRGRSNPQEGGPKGLDLDRSGRVLAVTSEHQPLALFDLGDVLPDGRRPGCAVTTSAQAAEATRTVLLRELAAIADLRTTLGEQRRRIADQEEALDHRVHEAATLSAVLESARTELVAAHATIAHERAVADDLARQLDALQRSTSWRATAPARAVSERLRRVARLHLLAPPEA